MDDEDYEQYLKDTSDLKIACGCLIMILIGLIVYMVTGIVRMVI